MTMPRTWDRGHKPMVPKASLREVTRTDFPGTTFPCWISGVKDAPAGGLIVTFTVSPQHIDEALLLYKGRNEPLQATFQRLNDDPS